MAKVINESITFTKKQENSSDKTNPANMYLFKTNNRNTRKRCDLYSKLITKTPECRQWRRSKVFIVNFKYRRLSGVFKVNLEHISHPFLGFPLLTLNK